MLRWQVAGQGIAFIEKGHAGVFGPFTKNCLQRQAAAAKVVVHVLLFDLVRSLIGQFITLIAHVEIGHISFLGDLDALLIGILDEPPEEHSIAGRLAMMKTVSATLLLCVVDFQVSFTTQCLDCLIQQSSRLASILLIAGNARTGGGSGLGGRLGTLLICSPNFAGARSREKRCQYDDEN